MQELVDGLILYHGSYCEVKKPELFHGAIYRDFGQGFYLTSSRLQTICASVYCCRKGCRINFVLGQMQH